MTSIQNTTFFLRKMSAVHEEPVEYSLGDIKLNALLGKNLQFKFTGLIECVYCSRAIKKTFGDGYCFPCSQKLARCDLCILKPELCHFRHGTCREPEWGRENCLIKHAVYLSNTSGLKVGITREHQKTQRWIDQGAREALVVAIVPERYIAGTFEVSLSGIVGDKTDWRSLIVGKNKEVDLFQEKERIVKVLKDEYKAYLVDAEEYGGKWSFKYPIIKYPEKAKTHNFDKERVLKGALNGIRGQYIFIDEVAVNIRKFSGYQIEFSSF